MRSRSSGLLIALLCSWPVLEGEAPAPSFPLASFHVLGNDPGSWPAILSSIGLLDGSVEAAHVIVVPGGFVQNGSPADPGQWIRRVEQGAIVIVEGESAVAFAFGFRPISEPGPGSRVLARSVEDLRAPELRIIWEKPVELPRFEIPKDARIFARERWQGAPLIAGLRRGAGAVLWVAAPPGPRGYERSPYILQALVDLGLEPPSRSARLLAFFDSSYRTRADPDYLAARWRAAGIGALHVAAWHFWESDPQGDEYLRRLIEACHRQAILVYAWIELPHVSEKFWDDHPEWREKTALLEDAHLDWRKLMNLTSRPAFTAAAHDLRDLLDRFDWDGVNLAELYFESLEGYQNAARFTPMNGDVRAEFRGLAGFDPMDLFDPQSPRHFSKNPAGLARFLEFRAGLAQRQQMEWIAQIEAIRKTKPDLDLTLTHVDDRFDTTMRDKIGADAARLLPMLSAHDLTFLIEDPATTWNLGPQRYPEIAARYRALTPARDKLAIDINVVERYQDVYPTKQQTGAELFQLIHTASSAFPRVALYFESSILPPDLPLLGAAASTVTRMDRAGEKLIVDSREGAGIHWNGKGPALVDGHPWPLADDDTVWLPRGVHTMERTAKTPPVRILAFNGDVRSAAIVPGGVEIAYQSGARALAKLERMPRRVEIDGAEVRQRMIGNVLILPRGQHTVRVMN